MSSSAIGLKWLRDTAKIISDRGLGCPPTHCFTAVTLPLNYNPKRWRVERQPSFCRARINARKRKNRLSQSSLVEVQLTELEMTFCSSSLFEPSLNDGMITFKQIRVDLWKASNACDICPPEELDHFSKLSKKTR
jgi:hypothetical protein